MFDAYTVHTYAYGGSNPDTQRQRTLDVSFMSLSHKRHQPDTR